MSHTSNGKGQSGFESSTTPHSLSPLLRALAVDAQTPIPCAECRRHFSKLYHHMQSDAPLPVEYQSYTDHLANCPACAEEYVALVAALREFAAGTLPEPERIPQFDLSFMDEEEAGVDAADATAGRALRAAPQSQDAPWLAPLADGLRRLAGDVWIVLRGGRAQFGMLPSPLVPIPLAGARLRAEAEPGSAEVLVLPASHATFSVHLTVGPVVDGKAAIAVKLLEPVTTQPLVGTRVTLRNSEHQLLVGAVTGFDGATVFEQLPLGRYFVQVRHCEQTWEIPLLIVEGRSAD